jgi:hypothetical protein
MNDDHEINSATLCVVAGYQGIVEDATCIAPVHGPYGEQQPVKESGTMDMISFSFP